MGSRYEAVQAEHDSVTAEIRRKGIRRREFQRFTSTLEKLPDTVTEFDEVLWSSLVEYVTVNGKDDMCFMLPCGVKIEI